MIKSEIIERKFIETINLDDYEVETDEGFIDVVSLNITIPYQIYILKTFGGLELKCADNHIVFDENYNEVFIKDLNVGDHIITKNGIDCVETIVNTGIFENMFDLELSKESKHRYYTNGILSHNTHLAKRLAYEMFGNEKNIVRLDMSEYADKTSVNKMYGSSPGYVGYDEGGILTEAIKKNNHCVLLLDEIEKAHEDVFNVLLQVFDDGRLTDNKGTLVDFKNVIIIMTSNVGAKDVSEKRSLIGFNQPNEDKRNVEIIRSAIKKTFKPEFINRIDNICFFNKLTDDNLRQIIINEVRKVNQKLENIGYGLDDEICNGKLIDSIFNKVKDEAEYGARPILREIQLQLEDKITDYIIDNDTKPGFIFTYNDIYKDND